MFIDLEDRTPDVEGVYNVKVESTSGLPHIQKARWMEGFGFKPVQYDLKPEEFITSWQEKH